MTPECRHDELRVLPEAEFRERVRSVLGYQEDVGVCRLLLGDCPTCTTTLAIVVEIYDPEVYYADDARPTRQWGLYIRDREAAREQGDPLLGIVMAPDKKAAEWHAVKRGIHHLAGIWAHPLPEDVSGSR